MTTIERLTRWREAAIITDAQFDTLSALVRKQRFSLYLELNALLYLGVISLVAGIGWTFTTHFERLGDVFVLGVLSSLLCASLYYCLAKAPAYSNEEVESANMLVDYALYFGCLILSVELGYIEFRFEWLRDAWDNYLLFSSIVFFIAAYRFDNRFVLSLALSSLAGWFGVKISRYHFTYSETLRPPALFYAYVISFIGVCTHRLRIKRHFLDTYLHVAINIAFVAMLSGLSDPDATFYLLAVLVGAAACVVLGLRFLKFSFVVYGIVFGYIAVTYRVLHEAHFGDSGTLLYFVLTGSAVILLVVLFARRFGMTR